MAEKIEQEKVLDALKCWANLYISRKRREDRYCEVNCRYYVGANSDIRCRLSDIVDDVERILNERTPMVLSFDALRRGIAVWPELTNGSGDHILFPPCMPDDIVFPDGTIGLMSTSSVLRMKADEYGKTWRCWSEIPGDELKEATAWLEQQYSLPD